jgi:hypothetical protein
MKSGGGGRGVQLEEFTKLLPSFDSVGWQKVQLTMVKCC